MIYLLHEEQVLGEVLQRECTWIKEINICPVLLVWDSTQQNSGMSTPSKATPYNFTTSIRCLRLCHHKCSTTDVTMKFGKGQIMKGKFQNFSLLPCFLLPHGKTTPKSLPKATPWESRASKEEEVCPQQCCQGQQEQSLPEVYPLLYRGDTWPLYTIMWWSPLLFKKSSQKSWEEEQGRVGPFLCQLSPFRLAAPNLLCLPDVCSLCLWLTNRKSNLLSWRKIASNMEIVGRGSRPDYMAWQGLWPK